MILTDICTDLLDTRMQVDGFN